MKKIILLLILVVNLQIWAQKKVYVLDSLTKEILPFAQIKIGEKGRYTNAKGFFVYSNDSAKTANVYFLGYKNKPFNLSQTDTVFLQPSPISLAPVLIGPSSNSIKIDFLHINKRFFGSFPLTKHYEILSTIVPRDSSFKGRLKQVSFKLSPIIFNKKKFKHTSHAIVRLNIYTNDNRHKLLYQSPVYKVRNRKKDLVIVKPMEIPIFLTKQGLVFGIEYLGHLDKDGNFMPINKLLVRPVLTDAESKFYKQNTMLRDVFSHKVFIKTFKNYFKDLENHRFSRNLALSFIFVK